MGSPCVTPVCAEFRTNLGVVYILSLQVSVIQCSWLCTQAFFTGCLDLRISGQSCWNRNFLREVAGSLKARGMDPRASNSGRVFKRCALSTVCLCPFLEDWIIVIMIIVTATLYHQTTSPTITAAKDITTVTFSSP